MKIIFACGGTGGHINPALAVAGYIKEKHPDAQISFIGNEKGMESRLVPAAGYSFYPIRVAGFQRKLTLKNIGRNISAAVKAVTSSAQAGSIIKRINPDLVVGTGGYVSGPVLRKAHRMGYKTATHEQNAFPGITTKMLSKYVDTVMLAMPDAEKHLPKRQYVVTGNPVRTAVLNASRVEARKKLGMDERPFILSFGGSLGARNLNNAVCEVIKSHCETGRYYHYHATGKADAQWMPQRLKELGVEIEKYPQIRLTEYINDMDVLMAAADLVISRAGAITLSEIEVQGKAAILIPSPNVAENHQYHNAMTLQKRGAGVVIEEKELSGERLIDEVERITKSPETMAKMGAAARRGAYADANERIYAQLMKLLK